MKILKKFVLYSSLSISGWYIGSLVEKKISDLKRSNESNILATLTNHPALPLFGTVSAATMVPYQPEVSIYNPGTRVREIMKYGYPSKDPENIRSLENYVLCYDKRNRVAHWVFEHLTKQSISKNNEIDRSKCEFIPDKAIHPFFRSDNSDYKHSGYDRGHLAAAGNHRISQKHCQETFLLSNMAPQVGKGFNRDSWNRLEKHVRNLTKSYANVYCCTGPLYLPRLENDGKMYVKYEVIGSNHVAVPTHFFKIVVCETADGKLNMESYVMPNKAIDTETPLQNFQVPPESIERAAGLLFFNALSRDKLAAINGKPR